MYSVDIQEQHIAGEDTNQNIDRTGRVCYHSQGYFGQGIKVAVIDTGIKEHDEFEDRILQGKNFTKDFNDSNNVTDIHSHGTHCAGTIAGKNVGVAPQAEILPIKVLGGTDGNGEWEDITSGVRYAIEQDVDIISMSLGGSTDNQELHNAIQDAVESGIPVFVAAGNTGDESKHYPGCYQEVVTVCATNEDMYRCSFSTITQEADLSQDGKNVLSCGLNNDYSVMSGTSMATPKIAGIAALIACKYKIQNGKRIPEPLLYEILKMHSRDLGQLGMDKYYGAGYCSLQNLNLELRLVENSNYLTWKNSYEENSKIMDSPTIIYNDRTYLPFRHPLEMTGADVEWFRDNNGKINVKAKW